MMVEQMHASEFARRVSDIIHAHPVPPLGIDVEIEEYPAAVVIRFEPANRWLWKPLLLSAVIAIALSLVTATFIRTFLLTYSLWMGAGVAFITSAISYFTRVRIILTPEIIEIRSGWASMRYRLPDLTMVRLQQMNQGGFTVNIGIKELPPFEFRRARTALQFETPHGCHEELIGLDPQPKLWLASVLNNVLTAARTAASSAPAQRDNGT